MAREVIWTLQAIDDQNAILEYWFNRTKSMSYPKKLYRKIYDYTNLISIYPLIGRATQIDHVRIKHLDSYSIIYEYSEKAIYIISISDDRQNPKRQPVRKK